LLAAWCLSCTSAPGSGPDRLSADLEPFLQSYFASWSRGDMAAYSEHFHPDAVIVTVRNRRVVQTTRRDWFVAAQSALRARSPTPPVERMLSFRADEDAQAATVVVQWELHRFDGTGPATVRGVDRFTLVRDVRERWKIVALVFYSTR
jgi:ketosteroid isomerase-like protein